MAFVMISMISCAVFQILTFALKTIILVAGFGIYTILLIHYQSKLKVQETNSVFCINCVILVCFLGALIIQNHQTDSTYRMDFIWKQQATGFFF